MSTSDAATPKRSCGRLLFRALLVAFVLGALLAAAAGVGTYLVYQHVTQPGNAREGVAVAIPKARPGMSWRACWPTAALWNTKPSSE